LVWGIHAVIRRRRAFRVTMTALFVIWLTTLPT